MKKSVVSRMSLRSDKDVETYLLKSRSDDNEKIFRFAEKSGDNHPNYLTYSVV
jgi:type IV secretory pathway VirB4 component